mmetsp:Transcript_6886/g.22587  ORF Transcript_6886/g.22587 Transcript_6886/m.22587 type:complete len:225 (+) Transcript_6886:259-933(+)
MHHAPYGDGSIHQLRQGRKKGAASARALNTPRGGREKNCYKTRPKIRASASAKYTLVRRDVVGRKPTKEMGELRGRAESGRERESHALTHECSHISIQHPSDRRQKWASPCLTTHILQSGHVEPRSLESVSFRAQNKSRRVPARRLVFSGAAHAQLMRRDARRLCGRTLAAAADRGSKIERGKIDRDANTPRGKQIDPEAKRERGARLSKNRPCRGCRAACPAD